MKKVLLAVCLMFGGATLVSAQEQPRQTTPQGQTQTTMDQDRDGQQISASELPDGVTTELESQDYTGWTVGNAYKKTDDSQNEIYVVEMRQGTETKKVKFDQDGNKLDKSHKDKDKYKNKNKDKADKNNYRDDSSEDATQEDDATDQADNSQIEQDQK